MMTTNAFAQNRLTGHPLAVDCLYETRGREDFTGESSNFSWSETDNGLRLMATPTVRPRDRRKSAAKSSYRGVYTSPPIKADFDFNEVLPSWNIRIDEEVQGYRVRMRFAATTGRWSEWFDFGGAGVLADKRRAADSQRSSEWGRVAIDYIVLRKPARRFQYQVELVSRVRPSGTRRLVLKRFAVTYSNTLGDATLAKRFQSSKPQAPDGWARVLPVPYRSQLWVQDKSLAGQICCPTSLAMILASHGHDIPTTVVASQSFDAETGIYGNWARAAQTGTRYGLKGTVVRFRSHDDVKRAIAEGTPVMASIRFRRGDLRNAHYQNTSGHLVLIRGLTPEGDYVVNDPYNPGPKGEEVLYYKDDMQKVWFDKGGVGIIFRPEVANSRIGSDSK
ncbi:MAG: C39 family peptidase [Candidatus Sumerlaeaceae bacterium]|nr:C39 family peptidase [Candidatus Sumerlaeaceae bacterium]